MRRLLALAAMCAAAAGPAHAADISGSHEAPNTEFGKDASYKLVGDVTFGWRTAAITGDIDLNGHALVVETGGGNRTVFSGTIRGQGSVEWLGGAVPQAGPSILTGEHANKFKGTFTLAKGVLDLGKPAGVDAIPGDLVIGTKGDAMVRLANPNQISDAANVTLAGPGVCWLDLQGRNEKFASFTVKTDAMIDMGDDPAALIVGDSKACAWDLTKTITILRFKPGKDKLVFGANGKGLSKEQLARIGFVLPEGFYTAKFDRKGRLAPGVPVKAANPPFDISPQANAERAKLYEAPGLANLSGKDGPLKDGMTIAFFGDSITWQNGYIDAIEKALKTGKGTKGRRITLVNRGINGGGVLSLRDGSLKAAFPGDSAQKPFAEVIVTDKANVAVIFIGINDVWWRKADPEVFEKALRDLVAAARNNKTTPVLATMTVHGELPDGKNDDDPRIEQYCDITRKVAKDTQTALVDLRKAYIAYLQNHNAQLRADGTLYCKPSGVLTYDGVHPNGPGVALLADLICEGICRALKK